MRIIVLGASGYLGKTIYSKLKEYTDDEILGTCCKSDNQEFLKINVLNTLDIKKLLSLEPDIIIWSIMDQEQESLLSEIGVREIVENISNDVRFIYVSTTVGKGKNQTESIIPVRRAPNEYLFQYINGKIQGESIVTKHLNHVIIRPGSIYGYDYDGKMDCRMKELKELSNKSKEYVRTANMYSSFVNIQDLADAIVELTYGKFTGIINISGEKPISFYDFNVYLATIMNIEERFIIPDYREEAIYHNLNNDKRKLFLNTPIRDISICKLD